MQTGTPPDVQQIVEKNRKLWHLAGTDREAFTQLLDEWIDDINKRLTLLRGDTSKPPLISVAIPVHDEEEHILTTLEGLSRQEQTESMEVLIIANNCSPDDMTSEIARRCGARVIEYQYHSKKEKPISVARQQGLIFSEGIYCVSTDGDTIARPLWIHKLIEPLKDDSHGFTTSHSRLYEHELEKKVRENDRQRYFTREAFEWTGFIALGNNMAYRKRDGEELGGFNLHVYPAEDTEFGVRLTMFLQKKPLLIKDEDAAIWLSPRRVKAQGAESILWDWFSLYKDSTGNAINVRESYKKLVEQHISE
ncbi:MAG: glycosyltransferase [Patescibacteria group bacterium]